LGEVPGPWALIGAIVVIPSIIIWNILKARAAAGLIKS
jgi:drug/metabolite transporter (DMT)-like permease